MNLCLVLLGALAQDPTSAPALRPGQYASDDPARPWQTIDSIVMIVNQDIITDSELKRGLMQHARKSPITSETAARNIESQILGETLRERLRVQGGSLLGVDEKLIDARVKDSLDQLQKRWGGAVGMAKFLESKDIAGPDVRQRLRDDIYDRIFTEGLTGEAPGPLGRVSVDRYIRPGALSMLYERALEEQDVVQALGGSVGRVKFQQIVLDVDANGGAEEARAYALQLLEQIRNGADMGELARRNSTGPESDGTNEVEEASLRQLFPEVYAFLSGAQPGELSAPMAGDALGKPMLRIVRFLDRTPPIVPSFLDARVQDKLRQLAEDRTEQYRLATAYANLLKGSYVWPPEQAAGGRSR